MEVFLIFLIVVIHEFGHYTAARIFKWRIRGINLWVFGGVMETDEHGNRPIKQEMIIVLAGPVQHVLIHIILLACSTYALLPSSVLELAFQYNATILLFNLLPVWPLDGGKLLMLILSAVFPYRKAHGYTIVSSIFFCVAAFTASLLLFPFTLSTVLLLTFILWENRLEWKQRYYVFLRFLLQRYRDGLDSKKTQVITVDSDATIIKVLSAFKRNYRHHIYIKDENILNPQKIDERAYLQAYFGLKQYRITAKEIAEYE